MKKNTLLLSLCFGMMSTSLFAQSNSSCANPEPLCAGTSNTFSANVSGSEAANINSGNNYGCLSDNPSPSWFYIRVSSPGTLAITMSANDDIDYAMWGPYASLTALTTACGSYGNPVDCSYSSNSTENATVSNVQAGEYYALLITNYESVTQQITVQFAAANTAGTDCTVLPVNWHSTTGHLNMANQAILSWEVRETQVATYTVERSADGKHFVAAGSLSSEGDGVHQYQYTDYKPVADQAYYRIRQNDLDGVYTYSKVIKLSATETEAFSLSPVPATTQVTVSTGSAQTAWIVTPYGRTVQTVSLQAGQNQLSINHLASGSYILRTASGQSLRFIKQ